MRTNIYGLPVFTPDEEKVIHRHLMARPCPVCKAKRGSRCFRLLKKRKKERMDGFHMGRVPQEYDAFDYLKKRGFKEKN
ncbi:MAG: hypothetical protein WCF84_09300 [Anaerolineae bacterium]